MIRLTRYASREHQEAMRANVAVYLGGNGPDWQAWRTALDAQRAATIETRTELMEGTSTKSPPVHLRELPERYRRKQ